MHRNTRSSLGYFAIWAGLLSVILYFNSARPTGKAFPWTTVRYVSSSSHLPEARGACPGLVQSSMPILVVARVQADGSPTWVDELRTRYHVCIYTADAPLNTESSVLQVPANRGHEAMAYLTFIIDNYSHIPKTGVVFIHGSRFAWHNDHPEYDNLDLLKSLDVQSALEPYGYYNLRCDWSAGTCNPATTPQGSFETKLRSFTEPFNARVISDKALPLAIRSLFGGGSSSSLGRADLVRSQCCAQFVVARERIWQHSRDEYVALRQWLLDSKDGQVNDAAPVDDRIAGRVLSYIWHILFMQHDDLNEHSSLDHRGGINLERLNKLACPSARDCYCRLYGKCDLQGCTEPGQCRGQYRLPPNYRLPADWQQNHS